MDLTALMNELIDITDVRPLDDRWVRLWFSDGSVKDVDLGPVLERGGVFAPMRDDRDRFCDVRVNAETGTIEWPGEVDLDPLVLYGLHEPATRATVDAPRRHARDKRLKPRRRRVAVYHRVGVEYRGAVAALRRVIDG